GYVGVRPSRVVWAAEHLRAVSPADRYQHARMLFELGDAAVDAVERDLRPTPPALMVEVHALQFGGCHGSVFGEHVHDDVEHFLGCAARQVDCRYNRHGGVGTVRKLVAVHQVSLGMKGGPSSM